MNVPSPMALLSNMHRKMYLEVGWQEGASDSRVEENEVAKGSGLDPPCLHEPPDGAPVVAVDRVPLHTHCPMGL